MRLGPPDGFELGLVLGCPDGLELGSELGVLEGLALGFPLGISEGTINPNVGASRGEATTKTTQKSKSEFNAGRTKVWIRTSAIDKALSATPHHHHPPSRKAKGINWGWMRGTIVSGGRTGADGLLDSSADLIVEINDPSNDYYDRRMVPIPGIVVDNGDVVMQNDHRGDRDDDDDDLYNDNNYEDDGPLGYPDDLIVLTHLHEPAVVHCLKMRYERDAIYTNTGPILIALNPFKNCSNFYSDTVMRKYWERGEIRSLTGGSGSDEEVKCIGSGKYVLPPHVYDLADSTYRSMMLKMDVEGNSSSNRGGSRGGGCDQSILVSGESGAGKTVTTKFIMQYLATLSECKAEVMAAAAKGRHKSVVMKSSSDKNEKPIVDKSNSSSNTTVVFQRRNSSGHVGIEQQVLQSNPILESFGNARTIRNDNSSRFGKFIEIRFDMFGTLVGASVETYLLEKVRLISQSEGERNYHIFYEMLCGMNNDELSRYLLGEHTVEDFRITSRSGTYDRRDGVRDADTYGDLVDALDIMGFETERRYDLFGIASAILHLSNLTINPTKGGEECEIDTENVHLCPVLNLLGVTRENLNQAMCYFQIEARGQSYSRAVQKDKAEKGLEALMKATYSALFDYIVRTINLSITVKKSVTGEGGGSRAATRGGGSCSAVIGVLDIFGFESFKTNSFEQLCINYCNESLQQQFNSFVLKNEQDIYEQEGINWSFISFPDNQDALDLIWKKGYGILNILDDQCRAPGTTDKTFANDLYQKLTNKPRFEANFRQVGARQFGVYHYAGLVEYGTDGFVEKNKDELPREATDLLLSSSSAFVRDLAAIISSSSASPTTSSVSSAPLRGGAKKSVTVGGHFASQLQSLRAKIELTSPHYVRCLKPNGLLVPDNFDPLMIVEQLRCAGVVEAVRVSRVGYPQRYNHSQFVSRYRTLGLREMKKAAKSSSRSVKPVVVLVDTIAKKMMEIMEKSQLLTSSPTPNDKKTNSSAYSVDLLAVGIQVGKTKVFLRRRAFDIIEQMRKGHLAVAAIKVQTIARGYINRRSYLEFCEANLLLQCWVRLILAIRKVQIVREHSNSKRIQSMYRQHVARAAYLNVLIIVKWCQCRHRGIVGRATYKKLVKLKRSATIIQCVIRIKQSRQILLNLKHEAKNLQNVAGERDKFRERMEEMRIEMERVKLAAKMEAEDAAQALREQAGEANKSSNLQDELDRLRGESVAYSNGLDHLRGESVAQINELNHLRDELASVKMKLGEEQEKSRDATECEQYTKLQLETARESIAQLEMTISEASRTKVDTEGDLLQDKLDEALDLVRMKEEEIKMLKCELSTKESAFENLTSSMQEMVEKNEALQAGVEDIIAANDKLKHANSNNETKSTQEVMANQMELEETKKMLEFEKENNVAIIEKSQETLEAVTAEMSAMMSDQAAAFEENIAALGKSLNEVKSSLAEASIDINHKNSLLQTKSAEVVNLTEQLEVHRVKIDELTIEVQAVVASKEEITQQKATLQSDMAALLENDFVAKNIMIDQLKTDVDAWEFTCKEKTAEIAGLIEQLQLSKNESDGLNADVQSLVASNEGFAHQVSVLEDDLAAKELIIDDTAMSLEEKSEEIVNLAGQLALSRVMVDGLEAEIHALIALKKDIAQQKSDMEDSSRKIKVDINTWKSECKEKTLEISYLNERLQLSKDKIDGLEELVEFLNTSNKESSQQVIILEENLTAKMSMIDEMSTDIQENSALLEEKSAEIVDLTELLQQTKAESDGLKTEVGALTSRNADNQYQISVLEDDLAAKRNTIDEITADIRIKSFALEEKITEITYLAEQLELSKDKVEANEQQIRMLEDDLANKTIMIDKMHEDIQQKIILLDSKSAEIVDLTELLQQTKAEYDGLKKEVDALIIIDDEKSQQMSLLEQNLAANKIALDKMQEEIQHKTALIEEKADEVIDLTEQVKLFKAESNTLKLEVKVLLASKEKISKQMSLMEGDLADKTIAIDEMSEDIQYKNMLLDGKTAEIAHLTEHIETSKNKSDELKSKIEVMISMHKEDVRRISELEDDLLAKTTMMSDDVQKKNISFEEKLSEITDLTEQLKLSNAENDGLKTEVESLIAINKQNSLEISALEDNFATKKGMIDEMIAYINKCNANCEEMAAETTAQKKKLELSQQECDVLKVTVCDLESLISTKSSEISSYDDLKERLHKAESRLGAEHTRAEEAVAREASLIAEMDKLLRSKGVDRGNAHIRWLIRWLTILFYCSRVIIIVFGLSYFTTNDMTPSVVQVADTIWSIIELFFNLVAVYALYGVEGVAR